MQIWDRARQTGKETVGEAERQTPQQTDKRRKIQKVAVEVVSPGLCQQVFSWLPAYLNEGSDRAATN